MAGAEVVEEEKEAWVDEGLGDLNTSEGNGQVKGRLRLSQRAGLGGVVGGSGRV